jgi:hypothetical protein
MTDTERLQARIIELETALTDYMTRYGITEVARRAMIGPCAAKHLCNQ